MSMILDTEKRAKDHIVFALKTRRAEENVRAEINSPRPDIRYPRTPKEPVSVEAALNEVMERFPQTLDYLGK
jgi:hypothetical protein